MNYHHFENNRTDYDKYSYSIYDSVDICNLIYVMRRLYKNDEKRLTSDEIRDLAEKLRLVITEIDAIPITL